MSAQNAFTFMFQGVVTISALFKNFSASDLLKIMQKSLIKAWNWASKVPKIYVVNFYGKKPMKNFSRDFLLPFFHLIRELNFLRISFHVNVRCFEPSVGIAIFGKLSDGAIFDTRLSH